MAMDIRELARLMDPIEFENYAAKLISGSKPLRRIGRAMCVLDLEHIPSLILCKHVHHTTGDVFDLSDLMTKHNFKRGYLITPGKFNESMSRAVQYAHNEIILLDGDDLEFLRQ